MRMKRYPYTIDNGHGEQLTFTGVSHGPDGDRAEAEGVAQPGAGPPMHVHYLQRPHPDSLPRRTGPRKHEKYRDAPKPIAKGLEPGKP